MRKARLLAIVLWPIVMACGADGPSEDDTECPQPRTNDHVEVQFEASMFERWPYEVAIQAGTAGRIDAICSERGAPATLSAESTLDDVPVNAEATTCGEQSFTATIPFTEAERFSSASVSVDPASGAAERFIGRFDWSPDYAPGQEERDPARRCYSSWLGRMQTTTQFSEVQ